MRSIIIFFSGTVRVGTPYPSPKTDPKTPKVAPWGFTIYQSQGPMFEPGPMLEFYRIIVDVTGKGGSTFSPLWITVLTGMLKI